MNSHLISRFLIFSFLIILKISAEEEEFNPYLVVEEITHIEKTYIELKIKHVFEDKQYYYHQNNPWSLALTFSFKVKKANILEIKIIDPEKELEEVPAEIYKSDYQEISPEEHDFAFGYEKQPFSFWVSRNSTGEEIFQTKDFEFVFSKYLLDVSTKRTSNQLFGLGERNVDDFLLLPGKYTIWNFDQMTQEERRLGGGNTYGSHPMYLQKETSGKYHVCFFQNSHAMDSIIDEETIRFITVGGVMHFLFFFAEKYPEAAIKDYHDYIGGHAIPPFWAFGFHQSRYGWQSYQEVEYVVKMYNVKSIPLDVIWGDIDIYLDKKPFTIDQERFPMDLVKTLLKENDLKYVVIIDPAIGVCDDDLPYRKGKEMDVFLRSPTNGKYLIGKLWPGFSVYPDWSHPRAIQYWFEMLDEFRKNVPFDGLWVDMNEPASFCDGECDHYMPDIKPVKSFISQPPNYVFFPGGRDPNQGTLFLHTKHFDRKSESVMHNLFGYYNSKVTYEYLSNKGNDMPFVLSRSTFPGSGKYSAHWTGDNESSFYSMRLSIVGMLNFNLFGIPMVGSDICGFSGHAYEGLCARWIQLGSLYPFSRNHNFKDSYDQELFKFGNRVHDAARNSLRLRYSILKHYFSLFLETRGRGTVVRPVFFEFPEDEGALRKSIMNNQFMIGKSLMASPVLEDHVSEVQVHFPRGKWFDVRQKLLVSDFSYGNIKTILNDAYDSPPLFIYEGNLIATQTSSELTRITQLGDSFEINAFLSNKEDSFLSRGKMIGISDLNETNVKRKCLSENKNCLIEISIEIKSRFDADCELRISFNSTLNQEDAEDIFLEKIFLMNPPPFCRFQKHQRRYFYINTPNTERSRRACLISKIAFENTDSSNEFEENKIEIDFYILNLRGISSIIIDLSL